MGLINCDLKVVVQKVEVIALAALWISYAVILYVLLSQDKTWPAARWSFALALCAIFLYVSFRLLDLYQKRIAQNERHKTILEWEKHISLLLSTAQEQRKQLKEIKELSMSPFVPPSGGADDPLK